jgi:hypothetical protein
VFRALRLTWSRRVCPLEAVPELSYGNKQRENPLVRAKTWRCSGEYIKIESLEWASSNS